MEKKIAEIKNELQAADESKLPVFVERYEKDARSGVQALVAKARKSIYALTKEKQRIEMMKTYEKKYANCQFICGIDEVGRGPLAGPVVAGAVILPKDCKILYLNDSKQLSEKKREELYDKILEQAVAVAVGIAENELIDEVNIYQATRIAMKEALEALTIKPGHILIDAMQIDTDSPQTKLIKGDARSASISAASIVAKVNRDQLMKFYDTVYPGYDLGNNAGYGTPKHLAGLAQKGVTPIHRKTFEPVVKYLSK